MLSELKKNKMNDKTKRNKRQYSLGAVFDKHIKCEFQDHDVDATMKTMVREPYVHHVPMLSHTLVLKCYLATSTGIFELASELNSNVATDRYDISTLMIHTCVSGWKCCPA